MNKGNLNTQETSNDAQGAKPSGKQKKSKVKPPPPSLQDTLDMLSSAIKYVREAGANVEIRNHPTLGAVILLSGISAKQDDWFEKIPNS